MATIYHQVAIHASVAKVYAALATPAGINTWWDKQTATHTDQGLVLAHNPGPEHGVVRLRVVALIPNARVEWECISTHPQASPASAWTGTHFLFELTSNGGSNAASSGGSDRDRITLLDFRQTGYDDRSPFLDSNTFAWRQVLQKLKRVVESAGHPGTA
jgi:uncharacterized protein YndB with AHSA1/START domain